MKDGSLIDIINLIFISLTAPTIHHCLSVYKPGEFTLPPEIGLGGGAQHKYNTRVINHLEMDECGDVFHLLNVNFHSSSPELQANKTDNIRSIIHQRIHSTGIDPVLSQPHHTQGRIDVEFLVYILKKPLERSNKSFKPLSSFIVATESSMQFSAVLPIGRLSIASSSQLIHSSNSNSNSSDITNVTKIPRVENPGLGGGRTIAKGVILSGG